MNIQELLGAQKRQRRLQFWGGFIAIAVVGGLWAFLIREPLEPLFDDFGDQPDFAEPDFEEPAIPDFTEPAFEEPVGEFNTTFGPTTETLPPRTPTTTETQPPTTAPVAPETSTP